MLLSYKTWSRRFRVLWLLKKMLYRQGRRQTSVYQIVSSKACLHLFTLAHYARNISPNGSALNTRNDFIRSILNLWRHVSRKSLWESLWRVTVVLADEGRVVGVPKFHSWGTYTMPLTNITSDWMSNAFSGLCIIGASPTLASRTVDFHILGECSALWGEREGVVWCITVFHSTTFSHLHTSHITITVSFPGLPHLLQL